MPELPDVEIFKRIADNCRGRVVDHASIADAAILKGVSADDLERRVKGKLLRSTRRHGKHLFLELSGGVTLALHFGMNGSLKLAHARDPDPPYTRLKLYFRGDGRLAYINPRRLGGVSLPKDAETFIGEAGLGPDALDATFGYEEFKSLLAESKRDIKSVLMEQKLMAGVGNVYSDEILFQARIFPGSAARQLKNEKVKKLFHAIRETLNLAIESGSGAEQDGEPAPRGFLLPQRRPGGLCPRCGVGLETVRRAGRTSYYCPVCQVH